MSPPVVSIASDDRLPDRADVVIVGGGIAGIAAAWHLARRGVSAAVVEKGVIAGEQSSRNWGYCRQQGRDPVELPLIIESLRQWRGVEELTGEDVGFRTCGIAYLAETDADVARHEAWLDHARQYQLDTVFLPPGEVEKIAPGAARPWKGALYTPSDGKAEPARAVPALARAARRLGVTLHQNCAARGVETAGGRVSHLVTEQGAIATDAVLVAGGAWSRLFLRRHGIDLPQQVSISSVMRSRPFPEVVSASLSGPNFAIRRRDDGGYTIAHGRAWNYDIVPDTFRLMRKFWKAYQSERHGIRFRIGNRFLEALAQERIRPLDQPSPFEEVRIWDPAPNSTFMAEAEAALKACFPAFAGLEIEEMWAGAIDATPDAVPVIDAVPGIDGLYVSTGYSGHGFGIGPGAGRLAADLVSGAAPCVDPAPFRFDRL